MDLNNPNIDTEESDEDYFSFVSWLSELTAAELRDAKGDPARQKGVLCRYYKRGEQVKLTASELIDFLGVSTPSILDMAGYSEDEGKAVFVISDEITEQDILNETASQKDADQQAANIL